MLKVLDDVCKPTKGSKYSAAIDLYAREDVIIGAGETVKVPLGVCIDLEKLANRLFNMENFSISIQTNRFLEEDFNIFKMRHYLQLEPRSSLRAKGLIAGTGIIDLDYKDEIMIVLHNPVQRLQNFQGGMCEIYPDVFYVTKGDKIAQILLKQHKTYLMGIDTQEERTGGFGSTDKK